MRGLLTTFPLAETDSFGFIVPTLLTLLGVAILIGLVAVVRKRFMADDGTAGGDFSLGGLRDLVRQGKMTQTEYDAAKAQIVAATQRRIAQELADKKAVAERQLRDLPGSRGDSGLR